MPDTGRSSSSLLSYAEALRRLLSLADYERMAGRAAPAVKPDLGRMRELAERLGDPHRSAVAVHITGTKGKGSVAAMVTSMLNAAGLRTVTFTSPHLHTFRERIRTNGALSSEEQFAAAVEQVWPHVEAMAAESIHGRPTTFEALTAMAFDTARTEHADVQVLEVGLGGRLDSTNIVEAAVSVITSISLDHMAILGDTIEAIAREKAGIIKNNAPVVLAPQPPGAAAVVESAARSHGATLVRIGNDVTLQAPSQSLTGQWFSVCTPTASYDVELPLLGTYQQENAAVAIAAVEALGAGVSREQVTEGLRSVLWEGRFQVVSTEPVVIVDGAHNAYSMQRLCEAVRDLLPAKRRVVAVFGCSSDKGADAMVERLARLASHVVATESHHPRAAGAGALKAAFEQAGASCEAIAGVTRAMEAAKALAGKDGIILITGSLFVAAEALEAWYGFDGERYPEFDPHHTAAPRGTI